MAAFMCQWTEMCVWRSSRTAPLDPFASLALTTTLAPPPKTRSVGMENRPKLLSLPAPISSCPEGPSHGDTDTSGTVSQVRPLPGFDFFLARTRQSPAHHHGQANAIGTAFMDLWPTRVSVSVEEGAREATGAAGISASSSWLAAVTSRTTWALRADGRTNPTTTTRRSLLRLAPAQVRMNTDGSPGFFTPSRINQTPPKRFLQDQERAEIVLRVLAGERQAHLAKEFGISRAAVHYLMREKSNVLNKYIKKHTTSQGPR